MVGVALPPCDPYAVQQRLRDEYSIEVLMSELLGSQLVRVSVQGYNDERDIDRLVAAMKEIFS
jgi:selenocysteine lyase/cysteine desulfurase